MELERFVLCGNESIFEAMQKIDENGYGIAFICENMKLRGVISDGDIRRYMLKHGDLEASVQTIANFKPKFLLIDSKENSQEYIKRNKITAIPILDRYHKLVRIDLANHVTIYAAKKLNNQVVIMAGGKGTRLYPYTNILPKPLIPIGEKTITEHIIERFERVGCTEFCMIVNYKKNLIKAFFSDNERETNVTFVEEEKFLGTGGGLKLLMGKMKDSFFMTNCDILIEEDYSLIMEYHKEQGNICTMVCVEKKVEIPYGIVELDDKDNVKNLKEKPAYTFLTNTGLYVLEPSFLDEIPNDTFIHITDVIKQCVQKGEKVGVYVISEDSWMDMGQLEELDKMKKRLEASTK